MILLGTIKGLTKILPAIPQITETQEEEETEEQTMVQEKVNQILDKGTLLYYGVFVAGIVIILITWRVLKK